MGRSKIVGSRGKKLMVISCALFAVSCGDGLDTLPGAGADSRVGSNASGDGGAQRGSEAVAPEAVTDPVPGRHEVVPHRQELQARRQDVPEDRDRQDRQEEEIDRPARGGHDRILPEATRSNSVRDRWAPPGYTSISAPGRYQGARE